MNKNDLADFEIQSRIQKSKESKSRMGRIDHITSSPNSRAQKYSRSNSKASGSQLHYYRKLKANSNNTSLLQNNEQELP